MDQITKGLAPCEDMRGPFWITNYTTVQVRLDGYDVTYSEWLSHRWLPVGNGYHVLSMFGWLQKNIVAMETYFLGTSSHLPPMPAGFIPHPVVETDLRPPVVETDLRPPVVETDQRWATLVQTISLLTSLVRTSLSGQLNKTPHVENLIKEIEEWIEVNR